MTELATVGGVIGTMDSIRVATVRYDYRNQMVEYAADDGFGPHAYLYDALGRRVAKRVADAGTGQIVGTRFISAGNTRSAATWQTIEEYDEATQMPTASYIHGNYIDEVLSMRRVDGSGVIRDFYYHQDDLFNVTMVTDASGAAVERYDYGDYGAPRFFDGGGAALGSSALRNARLFNGREWDAEVAMYYYRTRYLEPGLGRFTARDSIGVWGDDGNAGNGVAYAASSPTTLADPSGENACNTTSCSFGKCWNSCMKDAMSNSVGRVFVYAATLACGSVIPIPKSLIGAPSPSGSRWTNPWSLLEHANQTAGNPRSILRGIGRFLARRACPAAIAALAGYTAGSAAGCAGVCGYDKCSF